MQNNKNVHGEVLMLTSSGSIILIDIKVVPNIIMYVIASEYFFTSEAICGWE